jgi:hypothetical protein
VPNTPVDPGPEEQRLERENAEKKGTPAPAAHAWDAPPFSTGDRKFPGLADLLKEATDKIEALSPGQKSLRHGQLSFVRSRLEEVLLLLSNNESKLQRVFYALNSLEPEREPYQPGYTSRVWEVFFKASFPPEYTPKIVHRGDANFSPQPVLKQEVVVTGGEVSWYEGMLQAAAQLLSDADLLCTASDESEIAVRKERVHTGVKKWGVAYYNDVRKTAVQPEKGAPLKTTNQVGGGHYEKLAIDPYAYCHANKVENIEGAVIKYVTRWRNKGGTQDLEKAIGSLQRLIELEKANPR